MEPSWNLTWNPGRTLAGPRRNWWKTGGTLVESWNLTSNHPRSPCRTWSNSGGNLVEPWWNPGGTLVKPWVEPWVEPWWNPEPIWAETPKLSAVEEKTPPPTPPPQKKRNRQKGGVLTCRTCGGRSAPRASCDAVRPGLQNKDLNQNGQFLKELPAESSNFSLVGWFLVQVGKCFFAGLWETL